MSKRAGFIGVVAVMTTVGGCDEPLGSDGLCICEEQEVEVRSININTINLNSINLNSINLNAINLNGTLLGADQAEYVTLEKIRFSGDVYIVASSWLEAGNLFVKTTTNLTLSGAQLEGVKLKFQVHENGVTQTKTVKVIDVEPRAPGSDILTYDLQLKVGFQEWTPLCLDHAGEPTKAILIPGVWSPESGDRVSVASGAMTFACLDAALAKCVDWGYKPWAAANGQSLSDFHQACSRMVRADYCGDGEGHTTHGTPIHVLDQVGVQALDANANFVTEAEWGPDGAVCLNPGNMRNGEQQLDCQIPTCGAAFSSGGLIQSGKMVVGP